MLEWLLRKLFGIKKPASRKDLASKDSARQHGAHEELARQKNAAPAQREEPSIDPASVHSLVPKDGVHEGSIALPASAQNADNRSAGFSPQSDADGEGKVHIFNFHAWFYADPVKAALTLGLAFLSWLATYTGMLELIQANTGSLDIFSRIAIAFAVLMLMLMILYLLDSLYSGGTPTWIKPLFVFGYLFLTLISVGFGFGFYWKYLEAQTEATRSAESAVSQVQVALQIGQTRLEQLQSTFVQLTTLSARKATQEREHGNSCPNSKPGEGPRMRLRDSDSQKFSYAAEYITGRATSVNKDLNALNGDLKKIVSRDASTVGADGTRNKFLRAMGRKLDLTIARFNTLRTDPQLRQFRDSFDKRASTTVFPNGRRGTFRCPDVQLQTALRGVVRAIDDIPEIKNPKIAAVEGSEAIVEAFRRLAVTLAALPTLKLPPSPDELRKARKQAISAGRKVEVSNVDAGLSKRDYIPLSAAVFVDLCILLISLNRRYDNFEKLQKSVASAKVGQVGNTVLDIFEAHKNKISQEMLEIFHHAEFEHGRDYYLAVPLIKGSTKAILNERLHAKQDEISRSQHEAVDHKVEILDTKLQKLVVERTEFETMKLQLTNHQNRLLSIHNQLRTNREQLQLTYQGDAPEAFGNRPDVSDIDGRITKVSHDKTRCGEELLKLDRLTNGNFQRIEQTKTEIGKLKEQRTNIHRQEEEVLKGQLQSTAEHDLAKEARFLSNLCISLEANDILHLASIYPFQRQVRAELKKHNSRYYAQGRHYRVYRFRKVADTQSQMVLDLIMEASKRARADGQLIEHDQPAKELPSLQQQLEANQQGTSSSGSQKKSDVTKLRDLILDLDAKRGAEIKNLRREATKPVTTSPIDRSAPVLDPLQELSMEAQADLTKGLQSSLSAASGIGVPLEELANLGRKKAEPVQVKTEPRQTQKKLFGLFGRGSDTAEPVTAKPADEPTIVASLSIDQTEEKSSVPEVPQSTKRVETEPLVALRPDTKIDDFRSGANEDSLLPPTPDNNGERQFASAPTRARDESDRASSERALARLSKLKNLNTLVEKLDDGKSASDDLSDGSDAEKTQSTPKAEEFSAVQATVATPPVEKTNLTDPVILTPGEANQDRLVAAMGDGPGSSFDEPSEADLFQEGSIPRFLKGDEDLDEASEDMAARSWAKRLSPTKTEK